MLLWDGACHVHERFSAEGILQLKNSIPKLLCLSIPNANGT